MGSLIPDIVFLIRREKAIPPKGGGAKPRIYSRKAMTAGLPFVGLNFASG
jgi:hypothetical protein